MVKIITLQLNYISTDVSEIESGPETHNLEGLIPRVTHYYKQVLEGVSRASSIYF